MTIPPFPDWLPGATILFLLPFGLILAAACAMYKPPPKPPRPQLPSELSDISHFFGAGTYKQQMDTRIRYWAAKGTMRMLPSLIVLTLVAFLVLTTLVIAYLMDNHIWNP